MAILSIQSHVAYGHVGNSAAVFPLQRLGFEVWPVHTLQYSNHAGYEEFAGRVFGADHVREIVAGIAARGVLGTCRAVLSGYLGEATVGAPVLEAVEAIRRANRAALYACDPVMGDGNGGLYVPEDVPAFMRERAMPAADIVTPNLFELELLTGRRVVDLAGAISAAHATRALGPSVVLVTSLRHRETPADKIEMLAATRDGAWRVRTPWLAFDAAPNGGGDLVAALFLAHYLQSRDAVAALDAAAAAVFAVMAETKAAGVRELRLIAAQDAIVAPPQRFPVEKVS